MVYPDLSGNLRQKLSLSKQRGTFINNFIRFFELFRLLDQRQVYNLRKDDMNFFEIFVNSVLSVSLATSEFHAVWSSVSVLDCLIGRVTLCLYTPRSAQS